MWSTPVSERDQLSIEIRVWDLVTVPCTLTNNSQVLTFLRRDSGVDRVDVNGMRYLVVTMKPWVFGRTPVWLHYERLWVGLWLWRHEFGRPGPISTPSVHLIFRFTGRGGRGRSRRVRLFQSRSSPCPSVGEEKILWTRRRLVWLGLKSLTTRLGRTGKQRKLKRESVGT